MRRTHPHRLARRRRLGFHPGLPRGMTLIELLIVVAMLIILVSVTTALMQPVLADKEIREAARQLNAYIAGAIARAAETGRPAGIWIQRSPNNANGSFEVFYAEEPEPYAGDTTAAFAYCYQVPPVPPTPYTAATAITFTGGQFNSNLVAAGDRIQLNGSGPWYRITIVNSGSVNIDLAGKPGPLYIYQPGVPFQIRRQPRKSAVKPLEMPNGTVIDLANSGIGVGGLATAFNNATGPVAITFNPNGSIDRVYYGTNSTQVTAAAYLLIGRLENIGTANLGTGPNECRWVSVNHQTGTVLTAENMGVDIATARKFNREGKGMGG